MVYAGTIPPRVKKIPTRAARRAYRFITESAALTRDAVKGTSLMRAPVASKIATDALVDGVGMAEVLPRHLVVPGELPVQAVAVGDQTVALPAATSATAHDVPIDPCI